MKYAIIAVFLAVFALWVAFPAKIECTGDGTGHVAQASFYKHSIQNYMKVPWTNPRLWAGSSFLIMHPPLFYELVTLFSFIANQIIAIKVIILLSYLLAFYSSFLLAKEYGLGGNKRLLAGLLYAFSGWHLFSTFFKAAYLDASLGYALFPLPFLYLKRGLEKNMVPFVVSSALLILSHQTMAVYALPAMAAYYWLLPAKKDVKLAAISVLLLLGAVTFFFLPLIQFGPETGHLSGSGLKFVFDGGPSFPLYLAIPQWGIKYTDIYDRFWFMPQRTSADSAYAGMLHMVLFAVGLLTAWRKNPELAGLVLLSLGFFTGIVPGLGNHSALRGPLYIFGPPLAIFATIGLERVLKYWNENSRSALLGFAMVANVGGIAVLLYAYSVRSGLALPIPQVMIVGIFLSIFAVLLHRKGWLPFATIVVAVLVLEVLPNAFNPTMVFPAQSQTDPCQYPTGKHEFLANPMGILCPSSCNPAYLFQNNGFETASSGVYRYWKETLPDTSKCPAELGSLGIGYCFQQGTATKIEPAKFISSTSNYTIERDEPDNLVIKFDDAGHSKVRLGYFSFYKAIITVDYPGGIQTTPQGYVTSYIGTTVTDEIELAQSPEGFIEFDHLAGRVELKVVPPNSFKYSYLVSAISGIALLGFGLLRSKKRGRLEWLLLFGLAVVLAHVAIRLFWMVIAK